MRSRWIALLAAGTLALAVAPAVSAHPHFAGNGQAGEGQVIANGQNHPRPFVLQTDGTWASCESFSPGGVFGPAWYGLETAHHGPDSGGAGKDDGCYNADANPAVGGDGQNPALR